MQDNNGNSRSSSNSNNHDSSQYYRIAHTAEHAFIGSLQKLLGQVLSVRKVEHRSGGNNTAFILVPFLDLETVLKAVSQVNSLISEGRKVTARTFVSLDEAKKQIPHLRANVERISGEVRVVEIEGHDVAACAMEHAGNLRECDFFLVTRISRSRNEYEVDFAVGQHAKENAITLSAKLLRVCTELGANINTVENTVKKLKSRNESNFKKVKVLSRDKLEGIKPLTNGSTTLLKGIFSDLADEQIIEFAGAKIANANTVVLIANTSSDSEMANVVFARNERLIEIDCNRFFKQAAGTEGRGGGKPHFVTGVVKKAAVFSVIERIANQLLQSKL